MRRDDAAVGPTPSLDAHAQRETREGAQPDMPGLPEHRAAEQVSGRHRSLHARLVIAPIGCWVGSGVLDVASRFVAGRPGVLIHTSTWLVGIGLISAVVAGVAGMVEAAPIPTDTAAYRRVIVHLGLVMATMVVWVVAFVLRLDGPADQPAGVGVLVMASVGTVVLGATVYAGQSITCGSG